MDNKLGCLKLYHQLIYVKIDLMITYQTDKIRYNANDVIKYIDRDKDKNGI